MCWFVQEVVQKYKVLEGLILKKTSNHVHGFSLVWPEEQSQLNQERRSPGDLPRENEHPDTRQEFIWDELLSDWPLFGCREGSLLRLDPSGLLLLDPPNDLAQYEQLTP